eukprot:165994-Ditylum_brightwellii.AAC.1
MAANNTTSLCFPGVAFTLSLDGAWSISRIKAIFSSAKPSRFSTLRFHAGLQMCPSSLPPGSSYTLNDLVNNLLQLMFTRGGAGPFMPYAWLSSTIGTDAPSYEQAGALLVTSTCLPDIPAVSWRLWYMWGCMLPGLLAVWLGRKNAFAISSGNEQTTLCSVLIGPPWSVLWRESTAVPHVSLPSPLSDCAYTVGHAFG